MSDVWFLIAAFLAEVVGTVAGFGSSTVLLPFAVWWFDVPSALVLVAFLHVFGNVGRIAFFRRGLNKRLMVLFGLPSVLLTVVGALFVTYVSQGVLRVVLGVFLLVFSVVSLFFSRLRLRFSEQNMVVGGGVSGFLAGLIGTGGALRGAFLAAFGLKKDEYVASAAAIALAVDVTRIPIYLGSGFLERERYYVVPLLLVVGLFGSYTGRLLVRMVPQEVFRKCVLVAVGLAGIFLVRAGIGA